MSLRQNHRLWPYLGIVWCLFVLSVTAPRSWRNVAVESVKPTVQKPNESPGTGNSTNSLVAVTPSSRLSHSLTSRPTDGPLTKRADEAETDPVDSENSEVASSSAIAATGSTEGIGSPGVTESSEANSEESFEVVNLSPADLADSLSPAPEPNVVSPVRISGADDRLAMHLPDPISVAKMEMPILKPGPVVKLRESVFCVPKELLARLDQLSLQSPTSRWAIQTSKLLQSLTDPVELTPAQGAEYSTVGAQASFGPRNEYSLSRDSAEKLSARRLEELSDCIADASLIAENMTEGALRTDMRRAQYALRRRVELWTVAHRLHESNTQSVSSSAARERLAGRLTNLATLFSDSPEGKAWQTYLMIEQLENLTDKTRFVTETEQHRILEEVLARIERASQQEPQRRFIQQGPIAELQQELRHWLAEPVDLPQLLAEIESYEVASHSSTARSLAHDFRSLSWAADEDSQQLGQFVEQHYRNANLRIALSSQLANKFLPKPKTVQQDVYDTILGADVQGVSNTSTQLSMKFVPQQGNIRFNLEARGVVDSDTASSAGPATFHSEGSTWFQASKQFTLTPSGLFQGAPAIASADGVSDLIDVETDYDGIPLVQSVVRRIAKSQHDKSHELALEEVADKVSNTARERLDDEAKDGLDKIKNRVDQRVLTPTRNLNLLPEVVELNTTSERLIARLRLAGENQLAAHTPRPRAPSDSLLSVQLHQSAVNNVLEQLELDGKTFKLPELYRTVLGRFQGVEDIESIEVPEDLPGSVSVTLAEEDAIRVEFIDGKVCVTLMIEQLRMRRDRYGPFRAFAIYRPEISGLHATLVRDGVVQIQTDKPLKVSSQIVLRGVLGKVFSRNRPLSVVNERMANDPRLGELCVNQFTLDDGWLGIALGPHRELVRRLQGTSK